MIILLKNTFVILSISNNNNKIFLPYRQSVFVGLSKTDYLNNNNNNISITVYQFLWVCQRPIITEVDV